MLRNLIDRTNAHKNARYTFARRIEIVPVAVQVLPDPTVQNPAWRRTFSSPPSYAGQLTDVGHTENG